MRSESATAWDENIDQCLNKIQLPVIAGMLFFFGISSQIQYYFVMYLKKLEKSNAKIPKST